MKIVFLTNNLNFSGGRKLMLEYAAFLKKKGEDVTVLIQNEKGPLKDIVPYTEVADFSSANIPECDIIVATTPQEARDAFASGKGRTVHFCQGFELADLEQRISGELTPPRFIGGRILQKLKLFRKRFSWRRKYRKIDAIYRQPTFLVTVSEHLKEVLEKRYGRNVFLCRNGVHKEFFYSPESLEMPSFSKEFPLRIINVGPYKVSFKGIPFTLEAVKKLKEEGLPVHFTRVSPEFSEEEKKMWFVDEFHEKVSQEKLGELFRRSHVYISNSTEGEGFGLPAMEALSCGLLCILSDVSSYRFFSERRDYCFKVPEFDITETVRAVKKIFSMDKLKLLDCRNAAMLVSSEFQHDAACEQFENILRMISEMSMFLF